MRSGWRQAWCSLGLPSGGWVLVYDTTLCNQCRTRFPQGRPCEVGCDAAWSLQLKAQVDPASCSASDGALCVDGCPVGAITLSDHGLIEIDESTCVGCELCLDSCPRGALSMADVFRPEGDPSTEDHGLPCSAQACRQCALRIERGSLPICVTSCPEGAVWLGNVDRNSAQGLRQSMTLVQLLLFRRFQVQHARRIVDIIA